MFMPRMIILVEEPHGIPCLGQATKDEQAPPKAWSAGDEDKMIQLLVYNQQPSFLIDLESIVTQILD